MYSQRLCHLLVVAVSLLCLAQASWQNLSLFGRRLHVPRQEVSGGDAPKAASSAVTASSSERVASQTPSSATSQAPTSQIPSSTPAETLTSTSAPPAQSSNPAPKTSTSEPPATRSSAESTASSSAAVAPSSSAASEPEKSSPASQPTTSVPDGSPSSPTPTPVVSTSTQYITMTNSDGSTMVSTAVSKTTSTPELNSGSSGETSGMTPKTRNTIIGVVVGVGGAIVLGALAFVAWRIWGRKRNSEENDGLMDYDMAVTGIEKSEPGTSVHPAPRTPFQSTLENYHQPTQVNASSNF